MKLFTRYKEAEKKSGSLLNVEWQVMRGGYMNLGRNNWTFLHRLFTKGQAFLGNEKEFIIRGQLALDFEPRFSWVTFEFINPFEARLIYIWVKVWPGRNLRLVFNLGWRLTLESKKYLQNQIAEQERRGMKEIRKQAAKINGGAPTGGHNAVRG